MTDGKKPTKILAYLDKMLPELEALYKDIHAPPELSMQEMHREDCGGSSQGQRLGGDHRSR